MSLKFETVIAGVPHTSSSSSGTKYRPCVGDECHWGEFWTGLGIIVVICVVLFVLINKK